MDCCICFEQYNELPLLTCHCKEPHICRTCALNMVTNFMAFCPFCKHEYTKMDVCRLIRDDDPIEFLHLHLFNLGSEKGTDDQQLTSILNAIYKAKWYNTHHAKRLFLSMCMLIKNKKAYAAQIIDFLWVCCNRGGNTQELIKKSPRILVAMLAEHAVNKRNFMAVDLAAIAITDNHESSTVFFDQCAKFVCKDVRTFERFTKVILRIGEKKSGCINCMQGAFRNIHPDKITKLCTEMETRGVEKPKRIPVMRLIILLISTETFIAFYGIPVTLKIIELAKPQIREVVTPQVLNYLNSNFVNYDRDTLMLINQFYESSPTEILEYMKQWQNNMKQTCI